MAENKKQKKGLWTRFTWLGVLVIGFLSKFKSLIPLLKLGKFGGTLISMGVSVLAYAYLYTWSFAVGIVVMIFIHEMGHVWAAKRKNIPVSAPAFIPFLGALIMMKKMPQDAETEAYVAYGGPLLGTIGAVASFALGMITGMDIFIVIAMIGFFLNLFNMIPVSPLDGGRIAVAISRWLWIVGLIIAFGLILLTKSLFLILLFGLFVFEMVGRMRSKSSKPREITKRIRVPRSAFDNTIIPGEKHQRELPYTQYCEIQTQEEKVDVIYPGVGVIGRIHTENQLWSINRIQLIQTMQDGESDQLHMYVKINHSPYQEDHDPYYLVSGKTRLKYGFAYVGLVLFLIVMTVVSSLNIEQLSI